MYVWVQYGPPILINKMQTFLDSASSGFCSGVGPGGVFQYTLTYNIIGFF